MRHHHPNGPATACAGPGDALRTSTEIAASAAVKRALARAAGTWGGYQALRPVR
jgi:hypothetical protein